MDGARRTSMWRGWTNDVAETGMQVTSARLGDDDLANRWFPKIRSWIALGAPLELLTPLSIARIIAVISMVSWPLGAALGDLDLGVAGFLVAGSIVSILALQRTKVLGAVGCSLTVALGCLAVFVGVAGSENASRVFGVAPLMLSIGVFVGLFLRLGPMAAGLVSFGATLTAVAHATAGGAGMRSAPLIVLLISVVAVMTSIASRTSRLAGALDADTGTPNARGLTHRLDERDEAVVVGTVHLSGLAQVRSALGHDAGREVVRRAVEDLGRIVPSGITIGRGADDDVVLLAPTFPLSDGAERRDLDTEIDERIAELEQAVTTAVGGGRLLVGDVEVSVNAHLGVDVAPPRTAPVSSIGPSDGAADPPGEHLRRSSLAARQAMRSGRESDRWDGRSTHLSATDLELLARLRTAPDDGELTLAYQPQLRAPDGRIVAVEAMLRWTPADRDPIPPGVFIPLAERTGLIDRLTDWVLDEAIAAQARWRVQGVDLGMSVNVSPLTVRSVSFGDRVLSTLDASGVPPSWLILEVAESTAVDVFAAVERLGPLRLHGVDVAIDHFGAGHTSLTELSRVGLDELKIDRSFVRNVMTSSASEAVVRSACELAHGLGIRAVADGVDDGPIAQLMVALGSDLLQGDHFARPMPEVDLLRRVHDQEAGRVDVTGTVVGAAPVAERRPGAPLPPPLAQHTAHSQDAVG